MAPWKRKPPGPRNRGEPTRQRPFGQRVLELDPGHARALTALGATRVPKRRPAIRPRDFPALVDADGSDPQHWINLALACQHLKDEDGEESALQRALALEPTDLVALILRANLLERQGKTHRAALAYGAAASVSPPLERAATRICGLQ